MSLRSAIVGQFRQPRGLIGALVGRIMARRSSNVARSRWTVDLMDLKPDDRVLEIGCGPGIALEACPAKVGSGLVVGVDHSPVMIAQASTHNAAAIASGRLRLVAGDLNVLPSLATRFTKALMVNVAQFLPDMAAGFGQVASVMTPAGRLAVTHQPRNANPTIHDTERAAADIQAAMTAAGFVEIRIEFLPLKPVPAVCVLGRTPGS